MTFDLFHGNFEGTGKSKVGSLAGLTVEGAFDYAIQNPLKVAGEAVGSMVIGVAFGTFAPETIVGTAAVVGLGLATKSFMDEGKRVLPDLEIMDNRNASPKALTEAQEHIKKELGTFSVDKLAGTSSLLLGVGGGTFVQCFARDMSHCA